MKANSMVTFTKRTARQDEAVPADADGFCWMVTVSEAGDFDGVRYEMVI